MTEFWATPLRFAPGRPAEPLNAPSGAALSLLTTHYAGRGLTVRSDAPQNALTLAEARFENRHLPIRNGEGLRIIPRTDLEAAADYLKTTDGWIEIKS